LQYFKELQYWKNLSTTLRTDRKTFRFYNFCILYNTKNI
jgi:hypothetical protein